MSEQSNEATRPAVPGGPPSRPRQAPAAAPGTAPPAPPAEPSSQAASAAAAAGDAQQHSFQRIDRFLKLMADRGASDLHLSTGRAPMLRLSGGVEAIRYRIIDRRDFEGLMQPITPDRLWKQFVETGDADYAYELPGVARYRVNIFRQQRGPSAVFRIIPNKLITLEELKMPEAVGKLADMPSGLILVTGPTGSGKSTTLAALLHEINLARQLHVITIEDPIEFVHKNRKCLFSQKEIGTHSASFAEALRMALREDPDVVLIGEMRDLETIEIALNAADTGLLVLGTLHTNSAAKTVDRIISVFPASRIDEVRGLLANGLRAIVAQQLLNRIGGGRIAAVEVLLNNQALSSTIREGKTHQIADIISSGKRRGMVAMDDSLIELVESKIIEPQRALEKAIDKDAMRRWLKKHGSKVPDDVEGATGA